ncbi:hypothetical protein BKA63DRAFT_514405 [Paraphoma chrysanthemicola]|nr:hypothetical protein BKA63DRAFT_514405 [Paraphoma chrysanthemicola]
MATCFESGSNARVQPDRIKSKISLKELVLVGLGGVMSTLVRWLDMPFTLIACATYVVSPAAHPIYSCATCSTCIKSKPLAFAERLWTALARLCFAPYHLPEKLWRMIFPPPCSHNRCVLRRYISSPPPWYHVLRPLYSPLKRLFGTPPQPQSPFPFLNLPLELRIKIYQHVTQVNIAHGIQIASKWRAGTSTPHCCGNTAATTLVAEHNAAGRDTNIRRSDRSEDSVSYQLNDNGIIAVHASPPPMNLLLVNRQIYEEVRDAFLSTASFEVQPLTPNEACWRLDQSMTSTYEAIAKSKYAKCMRKVRVRIDVSRFSMGRQCKRFERSNAQVCTFDEIRLYECVQRLQPLAQQLCKALKESAPGLRVIELYWNDAFGSEVESDDLQSRTRVLAPFVKLHGVDIQICRLVIAPEGRRSVLGMARESLCIL